MFEMNIHAYWLSLTLLITSLELGLGFAISELYSTRSSSIVSIIPCRRTTSSSLHDASDGYDRDPSSPTPEPDARDESNDDTKKKTLSPLAMAAQDWLEDDDDDDELFSYWNRFDEKKSDAKTGDKAKALDIPNFPAVDRSLSTEQLLDQYYDGRGIDKRVENQHKEEIQKALDSATKAKSAKEAVNMLEAVRPWLQSNTKLGGNALLELGEAYEADDNVNEAKTIFESLQSNPQTDIKRRARYLLSESSRAPKKYGDDIWNIFKMMW